MVLQPIGCGIGGRQHLDPEAIEQRSRLKGGRGQPLGDLGVDYIGGIRREGRVDPEGPDKRELQPLPARGAQKSVPMLHKELEDVARIAVLSVRSDAQVGQRHTL